MSTGGQAVGEADGAVVGALLRASTSLTTLDLSGSSCAPEAAEFGPRGANETPACRLDIAVLYVEYSLIDGRFIKLP